MKPSTESVLCIQTAASVTNFCTLVLLKDRLAEEAYGRLLSIAFYYSYSSRVSQGVVLISCKENCVCVCQLLCLYCKIRLTELG